LNIILSPEESTVTSLSSSAVFFNRSSYLRKRKELSLLSTHQPHAGEQKFEKEMLVQPDKIATMEDEKPKVKGCCPL
jgi:hypothetical protein